MEEGFTACHARCVAMKTGNPVGEYCGGACRGRRVCTLSFGCGRGGEGVAVAVVGNRARALLVGAARPRDFTQTTHGRAACAAEICLTGAPSSAFR